jgi:hypothetical protein
MIHKIYESLCTYMMTAYSVDCLFAQSKNFIARKQSLLPNGCITCKNGVTDAAFTVRSVPTLHKEDQLPFTRLFFRQQLEKKENGARWPPARESVSPKTETCSLL